jgi:hypothetical protein
MIDNHNNNNRAQQLSYALITDSQDASGYELFVNGQGRFGMKVKRQDGVLLVLWHVKVHLTAACHKYGIDSIDEDHIDRCAYESLKDYRYRRVVVL